MGADFIKFQVLKTVLELESYSANHTHFDEARVGLLEKLRGDLPLMFDAITTEINSVMKAHFEADAELNRLRSRICDHHKISDPAVRLEVWKLTNGECTYCGKQLAPPDRDGDGETMVVEHVIPRSKGGPDNLVNYVPACCSCNNSKGDGHVFNLVRRIQLRPDASMNVVAFQQPSAEQEDNEAKIASQASGVSK